jgi:hypothetical protein
MASRGLGSGGQRQPPDVAPRSVKEGSIPVVLCLILCGHGRGSRLDPAVQEDLIRSRRYSDGGKIWSLPLSHHPSTFIPSVPHDPLLVVAFGGWSQIRRRALLIKNAIVENGDEKTRGLYLVMQLPTPDLPTNDLLSRGIMGFSFLLWCSVQSLQRLGIICRVASASGVLVAWLVLGSQRGC